LKALPKPGEFGPVTYRLLRRSSQGHKMYARELQMNSGVAWREPARRDAGARKPIPNRAGEYSI